MLRMLCLCELGVALFTGGVGGTFGLNPRLVNGSSSPGGGGVTVTV